MRLIDRRRQLLDTERGAIRLRARRPTPGCHDLDPVGALLAQLAHGLTHTIDTVSLATGGPGMAAGDRDRSASYGHARPADDPAPQRFFDREDRAAGGATLAECRDACFERNTGIGARLE
jgi:hypothetical protein